MPAWTRRRWPPAWGRGPIWSGRPTSPGALPKQASAVHRRGWSRGRQPPPTQRRSPPPSAGPPALETGAVLAVDQTVAGSANVVLRLPAIRALRSGFLLDVEVVS